MSEAKRAGDSPLAIEVEAGKPYFWCSCGRSATQPFCDGSHRGTGFSPVRYVPEQPGKVYFCNCKQTADAPRCDGSHAR